MRGALAVAGVTGPTGWWNWADVLNSVETVKPQHRCAFGQVGGCRHCCLPPGSLLLPSQPSISLCPAHACLGV